MPVQPGRIQCPLRIYVPLSELRTFGNDDGEWKDVKWLAADGSDEVIEFSIVFSDKPPSAERWPGKDRGTSVLWHTVLPSAETAALVYLQCPLWDSLRTAMRSAKLRVSEGPVQKFNPKAAVDLSDPAIRGIIGCEDDKGSRSFVEVAFCDAAHQTNVES